MGCLDVNLGKAAHAIAALPGVKLEASSPIYQTEPQEKKGQPWFANQVLRCTSVDNDANMLMSSLLATEAALGRVRHEAFGPRVIDIDLLLLDDMHIVSALVTLPHPRMWSRAFVLVPLLDVFVDPQSSTITRVTICNALKKIDFRIEGQQIWQ